MKSDKFQPKYAIKGRVSFKTDAAQNRSLLFKASYSTQDFHNSQQEMYRTTPFLYDILLFLFKWHYKILDEELIKRLGKYSKRVFYFSCCRRTQRASRSGHQKNQVQTTEHQALFVDKTPSMLVHCQFMQNTKHGCGIL